MRFLSLLVLAAVALSGCTVPEDTTDPLFGVCPQWVQGPWTASLEVSGQNGTLEQVFTPQQGDLSLLEWYGHPLDRYRVRMDAVSVDGTVQMRAYGDGQLALYDYRAPEVQVLPVLTFDAAQQVEGDGFDVLLSDVTQGSAPAPSPLTLTWDLGGPFAANVTVTALYKVCGAPL